MSTIAEQAINRAAANGIANLDHFGHEISSGYLVQGPAAAKIEWITPDADGAAARGAAAAPRRSHRRAHRQRHPSRRAVSARPHGPRSPSPKPPTRSRTNLQRKDRQDGTRSSNRLDSQNASNGHSARATRRKLMDLLSRPSRLTTARGDTADRHRAPLPHTRSSRASNQERAAARTDTRAARRSRRGESMSKEELTSAAILLLTALALMA